MGRSIYKFRGINENTINALENDEIYGTSPVIFNDPYDCLYSCDFRKLHNLILKDEVTKNNFNEWFYNNYKSPLNLKNLEESLESIKSEFVFPIYNNETLKNINIIRSRTLISCFCSRNDKVIMWSHYASNGKGFVLEYDEDDIIDITEKYLRDYNLKYPGYLDEVEILLFGINEMKYDSSIFDGTNTSFKIFKVKLNNELLENQKLVFADKEDFNGIFLHKNSDWQYESEIRLILPNSPKPSNFALLGKVKPKGIYMGEFIDDKDREILCKIAKGKGIPIYQMITIQDTKQFGLNARKLSDDEVDRVINKDKVNFYN